MGCLVTTNGLFSFFKFTTYSYHWLKEDNEMNIHVIFSVIVFHGAYFFD